MKAYDATDEVAMAIDFDASRRFADWDFTSDKDFDVETDDLANIEIRPADDKGKLHYFYDIKNRKLITTFVLRRTVRTKTICDVTLIRRDTGKFTPRLEFSVRDTSNKAIKSVDEPIADGETRTIKARVDLTECHEELWKLVHFLEAFQEIDLPESRFRIVSEDQAEIAKALKLAPRNQAIAAIRRGLDGGVTEADIDLLTDRKGSLREFETVLTDAAAFEQKRIELGPNKTAEDVWQDFFERNQWIFGYGLKLISCEGLDNSKLEQIALGSGRISGSGNRIDALMKTRGEISSLLFCEIKTPDARLTMDGEYRADVYSPAKDLRGGVAQVQKAIHKVSLAVSETHKQLTGRGGSPTGEIVTVVRPRGVVVIGRLSEFEDPFGVNYERFSSFELYRNGLQGLEVLTFDELLERARFIVERHVIPGEEQ